MPICFECARRYGGKYAESQKGPICVGCQKPLSDSGSSSSGDTDMAVPPAENVERMDHTATTAGLLEEGRKRAHESGDVDGDDDGDDDGPPDAKRPSSSRDASPMQDAPLGSIVQGCSALVARQVSIACWNVANLGGGFGMPTRRSEQHIAAIAQVIQENNADITVILEVLDRSRANVSLGAFFASLGNSMRLESQLSINDSDQKIYGRVMEQRKTVMRSINLLRTKVDRLSDALGAHERLKEVKAVLREDPPEEWNWQQWDEMDEVEQDDARAQWEEERAALEQEREELEQEVSGLSQDVSKLEAALRQACDQLEVQRTISRKIQEQLKSPNAQRLLAARNFPQNFMRGLAASVRNAAQLPLPEASSASPEHALLDAWNMAVSTLRLPGDAFLDQNLANPQQRAQAEQRMVEFKNDLTALAAEAAQCIVQDKVVLGLGAAEDRALQNDAIRVLNLGVEKTWRQAQVVVAEPRGQGGQGMAELERILTALGAGWVLRFETDDSGAPSYTRGETYGFFCRSAVVAGIRFQRLNGRYEGRRPVVAWCAIAGMEEVGVIAWHAPSCSDRNQAIRANDFPCFVRDAQALRASGCIAVLASDLNINTAFGASDIDCSGLGAGSAVDFFTQVSGGDWLSHSVFRDALTSFRRTRLEDRLRGLLNGLIEPVRVARGYSAESLPYDHVNLIEDYVSGPQHRALMNAFDKIVPVALEKDAWHAQVIWEYVTPLVGQHLQAADRYEQYSDAQLLAALTRVRHLSDHTLVRIILEVRNDGKAFSVRPASLGASPLAMLAGSVSSSPSRTSAMVLPLYRGADQGGWDGAADLLTGAGVNGGMERVACLAQRAPSCGQRAAFNADCLRRGAPAEMRDDALMRQFAGWQQEDLESEWVAKLLAVKKAPIPVIQHVHEIRTILAGQIDIDPESDLARPDGLQSAQVPWRTFRDLQQNPGGRRSIQFVLHTEGARASGQALRDAHWIAVQLFRDGNGAIQLRYADSLDPGADRTPLLQAVLAEFAPR